MNNVTRRELLKGMGILAAGSLFNVPAVAGTGPKARVVVVGGGYGGTIAAKYIKLMDPGIRVVLIEKNPEYVSCPLSNEALSGERDLESLTFGYKGLSRHGVNIYQGEVTEVDAVKRHVRTSDGKLFRYDRLVVAPGVDFRYGSIEGYDEAATGTMPHAWKAGPQTALLRRQLVAMPDGGVVYIVAPPNPFRCPPGPYERAAQIAHYFKQHKPRSKVIILDAKDKFSKMGLFQQGWKQHYGDMIEWVSGANGGIVEAVDVKGRRLIGQVDEYRADVANVIPAQKAGRIAVNAGLTDDKGWCPVDQKTFESSIHKDIHVIGDSCMAGKMPKSGYAANSQGKVCAQAIVAAINGLPIPEPSYVNTCYSIVAPGHGISVAAVYQLSDEGIVGVPGAGGLSPMDATPAQRAQEARHALSWFKNITGDMFL